MMKAKDWHKIYLFRIMFVGGITYEQTEATGIGDVKWGDYPEPLYIRMIPQLPGMPDFRMKIEPNCEVVSFRRQITSNEAKVVDGKVILNDDEPDIVNMTFAIGYKKNDKYYLRYVDLKERKVTDHIGGKEWRH